MPSPRPLQESIDLGTGRTAIEVTAGGNHTCALLDNSDVKCWGENDYGELGQEDTFSRGLAPNQMGDNLAAISLPTGWTLHSLSAGYYHTCALVSEVGTVDGVVCWGANINGQVGGCAPCNRHSPWVVVDLAMPGRTDRRPKAVS